MRKTKTTKLALLAVSLALLFAAAIGIAASAEDAVSPVVYSQNVEYGGNYSLMYAITAESVKGEELTLAVYDNAECAGEAKWSKTVAATEANQQMVMGESCYVFTTLGVAAKDMDVQYYVKVTSGEAETVKRYSVAEYFFERLYKNGVAFGTSAADIARAKLYNSALSYAADAQDVLYNYNVDESGELITSDDRTTFVTDMKYVYVANDAGTINGSYSSGVILKGTEVTFVADDVTQNWYLVNPETETLIGSIASGDSFTVNSHVRVDNSFEIRGSGLYANNENTITYTDVTHESLISSGLMAKNTNRGVGNNKTLSFADGAMQYSSSGSSWGAINFVKQGSDGNIVFETDIKIDGAYISEARASSFVGTSNNGTGNAGLYSFTLSIYSNPDISVGGYILKIAGKVTSETTTALIPEGKWVNIRYEFDGLDAGSATRLYVNGELAIEATSSNSILGIKGVELLHSSDNSSGSGFSSGAISFDNTYCGPKN